MADMPGSGTVPSGHLLYQLNPLVYFPDYRLGLIMPADLASGVKASALSSEALSRIAAITKTAGPMKRTSSKTSRRFVAIRI
jgi:hypothetical protein